jgi:starch phosphorylase
LHGDVSRGLFQSFFPRWPKDEVPIGHVTNGVHVPTWDSSEADKLWEKACGKDRWIGLREARRPSTCAACRTLELWQMRSNARAQLVHSAAAGSLGACLVGRARPRRWTRPRASWILTC